MARKPESSAIMKASHVVLVRLLLAVTAMTVLLNLMFLPPLEESDSAANDYMGFRASFLNGKLGMGSSGNATSSANFRSSSRNAPAVDFPVLSEDEGRQHILSLFKEAGVELTPEMNSQLPSWSQVQEVIGPHPYILGLENCPKFREKVPAVERMLGSAGMFNTGTNLVTHLLKQNCQIPERREKYGPHQSKESYGMR